VSQAAANKQCGECALCCKIMQVNEIGKPKRQWCVHSRKGAGCGIYESRPASCAQFVCLWLADAKMDDKWRPDRAKFMMWGQQQLIIDVDPAYPDAWRREPYYSKIKLAADRRRPGAVDVVVRNGREVIIVFPEADISLGREQELPVKSGYRTGLEPFAEYLSPAPGPLAG
jgi:hypothetical protein